ncbi:MAG: sodium:solute symporter family transporter [Myxococcota bacterium]
MIDLLLVLAFVVYAAVVALRSRRQASTDLESYFLAGRELRGWQSGLSMTATQYAADTPLLAAGLVATGGLFALWRLWVYGLAFLALGFLLGACWWRAGVVTDAELCELRYGGRPAAWLRALKAFYYGVFFNCAVLAMVLAATVRIAEPFLRFDLWLPGGLFAPWVALVEWVGVPLAADPAGADVWVRSASNLISVVAIYAFTVLYSATGGLRSVVRTDLGQLGLLAVATAGYAWFAAQAVGGFGELAPALARGVGAERARGLLALDPWGAAEVGGALLGVLGLQWLVQMNSDGTGYLAQRCMACRSPQDARRAPVFFAFAQIGVRSLLWLPILVALLVLYPLEAEPSAALRELSFVRGIEELLPPGLRGLMLVGMLAALASTLDTHLNWGASYLANDFYARARARRGRAAGDRELVWVARAAAPLLMLLSLAVMATLGSIQAAWHASLLLGAGLGVPLWLRWLWRRANAWSELSAIAASAVVAPLLLVWVETEAVRLLAMAAVGTLAAVLASLVGPAEDADRLDAFYARVAPPGFWGDPAARERLTVGLRATLAAAVTLFAGLLAAATWLVGAPPPPGWSTPVWIGGLTGAAVAALPFWAKRLR